MSNLNNQVPLPVNCCPPQCPIDQVICLNCCIPLSATCNGRSTQTVFENVHPCDVIDGFVVLTNESCPITLPGCTMIVSIAQRGNRFIRGIIPGDEHGFFVKDLLSISVSAVGANTTEIIAGEANLQLRRKIQLDC